MTRSEAEEIVGSEFEGVVESAEAVKFVEIKEFEEVVEVRV